MLYFSEPTPRGNRGISYLGQQEADQQAAAMDAMGCRDCEGCVNCTNCRGCTDCRGCRGCRGCWNGEAIVDTIGEKA